MKRLFKFKYIILFIASFLFSMCFFLTFEINYDGNMPRAFINEFHFDFSFFVKVFLFSILVSILCYFLFKLLDKIKINNHNKSLSSKKVFIINFVGLLLTGLLFLITFYPGNVMIDTLYIFKNPIEISSQHPIFYIWLVTIPFKVFCKLFSDVNTAVFLTCLIQLIIASGIISFIIVWFNNTFKNKILTILISLYFILVPIITNYNTTLVKDSIFCLILLCTIPIIYEIIKSNSNWIKDKKNFIITCIIFSLVCLVRNNGLYIILILLLILILMYKKQFKRYLLITIITLIISFIPSLFSNKQLFQEKVGIPLNQLAYVIYTDGKIDDKNLNYLEKIYDYDSYKNNYNPFLIDTIKWDDNFNREYLNNNSKQFIEVWIKTLPHNLESYLKSYALSTYGNWSIDKFYKTQSVFLGVDDDNKTLFPDLKNTNTILSFMKPFYNKTVTYLSGGVCFWILVFFSLYMIYKKAYKLLLLTVPLYGVWLSLMLATPFSLAFRYMSPFMYLLPFIILITIIKTRNKK